MDIAGAGRSDRFMFISAERIFYAGLLGKPSVRTLGALALCVPVVGQARMEIAGSPPQTGEILVAAPYLPHRIVAESRDVLAVLIEPETVSHSDMMSLQRQCGDPAAASRLAARMREAYSRLTPGSNRGFSSAEFDEIFLERRLTLRTLEPRIAMIVAQFQSNPSGNIPGEACAKATNLSLSRFLHLFKQETGMTFRTFRAWKRARNVLHHVNVECNLAHFALDAGYPDSTHFSHSVRRIYGLQPSAIFSGSRRLRIINGASVPGKAAITPA